MLNSYQRNTIVDLHIHTTKSDGRDSVVTIVKTAAKNNLTAVAITDHDTVSGIETALIEAENYNLEIISGVELSVYYKSYIHILGLFVDYRNTALNNHLQKVTKERMRLIIKAVKIVRNNGINILPQQIIDDKGYLSIKNLGEYLLEHHLIENKQILDSLLCSVWDEWRNCLPSVQEGIAMIHASNGLSVLAHAKLLCLDDTELESLLIELHSYGLDGVELIHPKHSAEDVKKLKYWADSLGLLYSGGSDYHGKGGQDTMLSNKNGKAVVPYSWVEKMKATISDRI